MFEVDEFDGGIRMFFDKMVVQQELSLEEAYLKVQSRG